MTSDLCRSRAEWAAIIAQRYIPIRAETSLHFTARGVFQWIETEGLPTEAECRCLKNGPIWKSRVKTALQLLLKTGILLRSEYASRNYHINRSYLP